jgi:DNA mismatch repair ATPase MutS
MRIQIIIRNTGQEFVVKDRLVKNTVEEISVMSNSVLDELLAEVRDHIGFLYQLSENLALLDLLRSLATVSMSTGFVKGNWSQYEYGSPNCL